MKNAKKFVTPPTEANASTHPVVNAAPGTRRRRHTAPAAAPPNHTSPANPTNPRYGANASVLRQSDHRRYRWPRKPIGSHRCVAGGTANSNGFNAYISVPP
ncbi:MAG: hypothetical protein CK538_04240 [Opitutia bacterium]|nr:MAG: hypothetical protein CK538_04240 [Opitutae bacterium]